MTAAPATPVPLLAKHLEADGQLTTAEKTIAQFRRLAAYAAHPFQPHTEIIDGSPHTTTRLNLPDGTLLLVNDTEVWVRKDSATPYPDGDWWQAGKDETTRTSIDEVIDGKRFEVLLTADDINAVLRGA